MRGMMSAHKVESLILFVGALAALMIVLFFNPYSGGPVVVVTFLAAIFALLFSATAKGIRKILSIERIHYTLSTAGLYYASLVVAIGSIFLLGLSTIGQLQMTDVLLVLVFEILANFYILRRL